jgi:hypothetical protein
MLLPSEALGLHTPEGWQARGKIHRKTPAVEILILHHGHLVWGEMELVEVTWLLGDVSD